MRRMLPFMLSLALLPVEALPAQDKKDDPPDKKGSDELLFGKSLAEWMRELKDPDPSMRREALQAVGYFKGAADAVPQIVHILNNDPDAPLRATAAIILMNIEIHDKHITSVVEGLTKELKTNYQVNVRYHCAVSLGRFAEAKSAIPVLLDMTRYTLAWEVRQAACASLAQIHTGTNKQVPESKVYYGLINALGDAAAKVRFEALMSLLALGTPSDPQVKQAMDNGLLRRVNDREKAITVWAYYGLALNNRVSDIYINAIAKLLREGDVPTRIQSMRALSMIIREVRGNARKKLSLIVDTLGDPDPVVTCTAATTLVFISEKCEIDDDTIARVKALADHHKDAKKQEWLMVHNVAKFAHGRLTGKIDKDGKPVKSDKPVGTETPVKKDKP